MKFWGSVGIGIGVILGFWLLFIVVIIPLTNENMPSMLDSNLDIDLVQNFKQNDIEKWNTNIPNSILEYSEYVIDLDSIVEKIQNDEVISVLLESEKFNLKLEPNNLLAPDAWTKITLKNGTNVDVPKPKIMTLKGKVVGFEDVSDIRLTITEHWISGFIKINYETFTLTSLNQFDKNVGDEKLIIYKDSNTKSFAVIDDMEYTTSPSEQETIFSQLQEVIQEKSVQDYNLICFDITGYMYCALDKDDWITHQTGAPYKEWLKNYRENLSTSKKHNLPYYLVQHASNDPVTHYSTDCARSYMIFYDNVTKSIEDCFTYNVIGFDGWTQTFQINEKSFWLIKPPLILP